MGDPGDEVVGPQALVDDLGDGHPAAVAEVDAGTEGEQRGDEVCLGEAQLRGHVPLLLEVAGEISRGMGAKPADA